MMAADGYYIYTGRDGAVIPPGVTRVRIYESVTVIPACAFQGNRNIEEVECHDRVKTVEEEAFRWCFSLRRVIMPGVEEVEDCAFYYCFALTDVECGKLEIIGRRAFDGCKSLGSVDLPSAKIVEDSAFYECTALTNVKFGKKLEIIKECAFWGCPSLVHITIPLKDGIITDDDIFRMCKNLKHVDLIEGALHDTIDALLLEEWRNDMKDKLGAINQILPSTPAGDDFGDVGGKAQAIRRWLKAVLGKINHYKAQHQHVLEEAAATLQVALPQDITLLRAFIMMAADGWFIYNGRDGEVIPPGVTRVRIDESVTVIPAYAFNGNWNLEIVECHIGVKTVEGYAFRLCPSLRRCYALTYVECDKLEIIRFGAFAGCKSLGSINLPSAKIIGGTVFKYCTALTNVKFGKELESTEELAFVHCTSLERITIPLKDGMITENDTFIGSQHQHVLEEAATTLKLALPQDISHRACDKKNTRCSIEGCTRQVVNQGVCVSQGAIIRRCSIEGCTNQVVKSGVCIKHGAKRKTCSFEGGCQRQIVKDGVCVTHEARVKRCCAEGCQNQAIKGGVCIRHGAKR
ncbi:leucine-rich repeat domain-containing protein [Skeletonema marinoi]|uniref:Leucine-rich repeat domain-containing protein n=1 Tax=Skeletonema marinoi TaxID=267567 RepID=A0AAD9D497_9STRA|nr:leucine-rich repeat domain-containing protein [Skeletonema marinoi]